MRRSQTQQETIADPACGTGSFFLAAYHYLTGNKLDRGQKALPISTTSPNRRS